MMRQLAVLTLVLLLPGCVVSDGRYYRGHDRSYYAPQRAYYPEHNRRPRPDRPPPSRPIARSPEHPAPVHRPVPQPHGGHDYDFHKPPNEGSHH